MVNEQNNNQDDDLKISLESKAFLISLINPIIVGHTTESESLHSLNELKELMRTLGIEVLGDETQNLRQVNAGTVIGAGKLEVIGKKAKELEVNLLVFDIELTGSQIKNIKKITGLSVIDRCQVILEIFAKHARTREAKIQIEMSRLNYLLPRLAGFWGHLNRQRGGVGVLGGEGEQQIELDRRIIKTKIEYYKKELVEIARSREQQKKRRSQNAVTAALVGYTNAGKSSLMNRLCKVNVLEENKLFATLDATYRTLNPDSKPNMVMIDTVGFISNLPNTLVQGFKTTLESALEADLLVIVCDISDPNFEKHLKVTDEVLKELNVVDKERLIVFTKSDLVKDDFKKKMIKRTHAGSFVVSTMNPEDMEELRTHIINFFLSKQNHFDLFVPYEDGHAHAAVVGKTNVMATNNLETGIYYRIKVPDFIFNSLGLHRYILSPEHPLLQKSDK